MNAVLLDRGDAVLAWLVRTSWQVGVLVLALLLLERLCGRWLTPRWRVGLWSLALLRLLLPALPEVGRAPFRWELPGLVAEAPARLGWTGAAAPGALRPAPQDELASAPETQPVSSETRRPRGDTTSEAEPARPALTSNAAPPPATMHAAEAPLLDAGATDGPSPRPRLRTSALLLATWLTGALALALRGLWLERRFRRRLAGEAPTSDPRLRELLDELRQRLRVRRAVDLVVCELVPSPAVAGWRRPHLLLPGRVARDFGPAELRHVLAHELAHVRHGDVARNALALLLRCVWWFHPLVHLAVSRWQSAQESARDQEALESLREGPLPYARTMLKLLETRPSARLATPALGFLDGGRATKRRVLMILEFRRPRNVHRFLGASLVALVGWGAFTRGAAEGIAVPILGGLGISDETDDAPLRQIVVERDEPDAPWKAELQAALAGTVTVEYDETRLADVLADLRSRAGVNLVASPSLLGDYSGQPITLRLKDATIEQVLRLVCLQTDSRVGFCLARQAVFVGYIGEIPAFFELRVYNVEPLLQDLSEEERGWMSEHLVDLVRFFTGSDEVWDVFSGTSATLWNGLFLVKQTEAAHRDVQAFLELLLNGGRTPATAPAEPWRTRLLAKLEEPASIDVTNTSLRLALQQVQRQHEVSILVDPDVAEEPVSLQLRGVPLGTVLSYLGDFFNRRTVLRDGTILLSERWELALAAFDNADLLREHDEGWEERVASLDDLLRTTVAPSTWEENSYVGIEHWGDLMIVKNQPEVLVQIERFLETMRRARGG